MRQRSNRPPKVRRDMKRAIVCSGSKRSQKYITRGATSSPCGDAEVQIYMHGMKVAAEGC